MIKNAVYRDDKGNVMMLSVPKNNVAWFRINGNGVEVPIPEAKFLHDYMDDEFGGWSYKNMRVDLINNKAFSFCIGKQKCEVAKYDAIEMLERIIA